MERKLITCIVVLVFSLTFFLTGCGKDQPQTATLALSSNPTTGYSWRVEQEPEIFDITSEFTEDAADEEMVGVGGTETFTLTPKAEGTTEINFYYEQAWDKDSMATHLMYKVSVDSNMQITVESQNAEMPGDESEVPEMPEMVVQ